MTSETDAKATDEAAAEDAQPLQLQVDITSPTACERHVRVTVARDDIDRYFNEAVGELMDEANVPGFRPGRAPRKLVESHFRQDLTNKIKGSLLMDSMAQVTEEADFSAISEPDFDFDAVEIPEEGPFTFEFDIEVRPEFDLPKWKGLKLEKPSKEFDKKDVDQHLAQVLQGHSAVEPIDEPADLDDVLVVNFKFSHNGERVGRLDDQEVRLRNDLSFEDATLVGFGKLMKGAKAGDKQSAKVTISNHADRENLRGKEVDIEIEVLDVKRLVPPRITDDILSALGDFKSEGDLRDAVKNELERQLKYHQNQSIRKQITDLLTESAAWELPPDLLRRQAGRELQRAVMELRSSGFSDEQIRSHSNTLRQNSGESTARALKEHFILERIAEDEEIEASDEQYDYEIQMMAMQSRESPRSVRARIEKQGLMDALRNQIIENGAIERIKEEATFKEAKWTPQKTQVSPVVYAIAGSADAIPAAKHGGDKVELQQPVDHT